MPTSIAVIGAGLQGTACALDLIRSEGVSEVRLLDRDAARLESARARVETAGRAAGRSSSVEAVRLDAGDGAAVSDALKGAGAAISAAPYFLNVGLARAAIRAGVSFCDMGGNTDIVREELEFHREAVDAGISVIPDVGLAPGLGNILAAEGIAAMDEPEEAHVRAGGLPQRPKPPLGYKLVFSALGLINEYAGEACLLRDGLVSFRPALSELERLEFPAPVGRCEAFLTAGGISTLPWTYQGRLKELTYKTVRYPGHAEAIRTIASLGLFSLEPVTVPCEDKEEQVRVRPRDISAAVLTAALDLKDDPDVVVLRVTVVGRRGGRRVTRTYEMIDFMDEESGMTAMMRTTAFPASIVAQMQARGETGGPGALPPELAIPPAPFLRELAIRGISPKTTEHVS